MSATPEPGARIEELCRQAGIVCPAGWQVYFETTKRWSRRTDLTAAKSDAELAEILFVDAANLIASGWVQGVQSMVDVGAGAGAPTLPLLLAAPYCRATLVEPRRKRTTFLRSAIGSLGLAQRVQVLEAKVDPEAPVVEGGPFDVALSRATFAPDIWLRVGERLAKEVWVLTAGTASRGEVASMRVGRQIDYRIPSTAAPRTATAYVR